MTETLIEILKKSWQMNEALKNALIDELSYRVADYTEYDEWSKTQRCPKCNDALSLDKYGGLHVRFCPNCGKKVKSPGW